MNFKAMILAGAAVCATPVTAGGWTSGGGELLESSMNPWWVMAGGVNPERLVLYCIDVDEANFGVSKEELRAHVRSALNFWRDEFASAFVPNNSNAPGQPANAVFVAKEVFMQAEQCSDAIPLRFQFGVLTDAQRQEFQDRGTDPKRFVALAVRTEYDEVTMQSKGFVYVAPPRGPLGMSAADVADEPWRLDRQRRLFTVLAHELGHVFGLQHSGTHVSLMGAELPEHLVSRSTRNFYATPGVFKIPHGANLHTRCWTTEPVPEFTAQFFGMSPEDHCIAFRLQPDLLEVVASGSYDEPFHPLGTAHLSPAITKAEPLVRVWLPESQQVFRGLPPTTGRIIAGPMAIERATTATYDSIGIQRELQITLNPQQIRIGGIWNNKIVLDVFAR